MPNWVDDLQPNLPDKSDRTAPVSATKEWRAADSTIVKTALADIRTKILNGEMVVNPNGATAVSAVGKYRFRCNASGEAELSENGGPYLKVAKQDLRNVTAWGADPTGVVDSTAAIQAAIDYAIYVSKRGPVFLDGQKFKTSDTIHVGYGESFHSISVIGGGYNYRGFGTIFCGTCLEPTFADRPCVNIQGARGTEVHGFSCLGKLFDWIESHALAGFAPTVDDTVPANWDGDAAYWATQLGLANGAAATAAGYPGKIDSRYRPYAAITIDAYSGTRPGTSYPDVNYPSNYYPSATQYGKAFSSDVLIEDIQITGFVTALANQPCDADGNGDFTILRRINIDSCKWGISICNTQSRNVAIENVKMGGVLTGLVNNKHGRQNGKFNGAIINLSMGASLQIFDFNGTSIAGPVEFTNFYGEAMWRLGDAPLATAAETSIRFRQSLISFENQTDTRGVPADLMGVEQAACDLAFVGCTFNNFRGVANFNLRPHFDGCTFFSAEYGGGGDVNEGGNVANPYRRFALNYLCGGVVVPQFNHAELNQKIKFTPISLGTGNRSYGNPQTGDYWRFSQRDLCIPSVIRTAMPRNDPWRQGYIVPQQSGQALDKTAFFSAVTLVNRTLTLTCVSLPDYYAFIYGLLPGDVLRDDETGTVFFIRSRSTTTVIAEQQNNYKSDGAGGWVCLKPFTTNGYIYAANTRFFCPDYSLLGTLDTASAIITNAGRDDGYAGFIEGCILVGDRLFINSVADGTHNEDTGNVTARSNAGQTITLGFNARYNQDRHTFPFWIRLPPANQATRLV